MDRIKYNCSNCRFEFTRKADFVFEHCPYCGQQGTVSQKTNNFASEIISEVAKY